MCLRIPQRAVETEIADRPLEILICRVGLRPKNLHFQQVPSHSSSFGVPGHTNSSSPEKSSPPSPPGETTTLPGGHPLYPHNSPGRKLDTQLWGSPCVACLPRTAVQHRLQGDTPRQWPPTLSPDMLYSYNNKLVKGKRFSKWSQICKTFANIFIFKNPCTDGSRKFKPM